MLLLSRLTTKSFFTSPVVAVLVGVSVIAMGYMPTATALEIVLVMLLMTVTVPLRSLRFGFCGWTKALATYTVAVSVVYTKFGDATMSFVGLPGGTTMGLLGRLIAMAVPMGTVEPEATVKALTEFEPRLTTQTRPPCTTACTGRFATFVTPAAESPETSTCRPVPGLKAPF